MSSSSVCQGLQSCLEPRLIEPRVLRLKLAPPKSNSSLYVAPTPGFIHPDCLHEESHAEEENNHTTITADTEDKNSFDDFDLKSQTNADLRGWSFLQFLSQDKKETTSPDEKEEVYVHPLVKRSASMLSEKSLEMCTESLGSETGSHGSEISSEDISLISLETEICETGCPPEPRRSSLTRKMNRSFSFPPPLTSISGSNGVQVRPHREGGRLVLEAVTVTSSHGYLHAERGEGRLRLCMVKDCPPNTDNEDDREEEEEVGEEYDIEEDEEEYSEKVRGEMGLNKLPMPSRCSEGGRGSKGLLWGDSFWVAT